MAEDEHVYSIQPWETEAVAAGWLGSPGLPRAGARCFPCVCSVLHAKFLSHYLHCLQHRLGAQRSISNRSLTLGEEQPMFLILLPDKQTWTVSPQGWAAQGKRQISPSLFFGEGNSSHMEVLLSPWCAAAPLTVTQACLHRCTRTLFVKVRRRISSLDDPWGGIGQLDKNPVELTSSFEMIYL